MKDSFLDKTREFAETTKMGEYSSELPAITRDRREDENLQVAWVFHCQMVASIIKIFIQK